MLQYLPTPVYGFPLQFGYRHDGIDQTHLQRGSGIILAAEEPDLPGFFLATMRAM